MGNSTTKLSKKDLGNIRAKTLFSDEEIKRWYDGFLNDCPTGNLTKTDFLNIYGKSFPGGNSDEFARVVFNQFDSNGDGFIQFDEFLIALSITSRGPIQTKLEWAFQLYDINGDGSITKKEMLKMIKSMFNMVGDKTDFGDMTAEKRVDTIFKLMDKDGDGELSKEEFIIGAAQDSSIITALTNIVCPH